MAEESTRTIEGMESWISRKPYWEQYLWAHCYKYPALTEEVIDRGFELLSEELGIGPQVTWEKPVLDFRGLTLTLAGEEAPPEQLRLAEIRAFADVNAIPETCAVPFHSQLTLIYGANGSGKTGIARLLANACFCRGKRDILPDLRKPSTTASNPRATIVLSDGSETPRAPISYARGVHHPDLKRFAVFDTKSVPLHLDESNTVSFTPAHIQVFDRVADAIRRLERRLDGENQKRRRDNPVASLFLDPKEQSDVATFCRSLSAKTTDEEFSKYANYEPATDDVRAQSIEREIAEKRRLDVGAKRASLLSEERDLLNLSASLEQLVTHVGIAKEDAINQNARSIGKQNQDIAAIGARTFDDGLIRTTGSPEWRALLLAARALHAEEKVALQGIDPGHCLLCRQTLRKREQELFGRYWRFLESNAEAELVRLRREQRSLLQSLNDARARMPTLDDALVAVRVLRAANPELVTRLSGDIASIGTVLDDWILKVEETVAVDRSRVPTVDLTFVRTLAADKKAEASRIVDPAGEITRLQSSLLDLRHRKLITELKDKALDYLDYLRWRAKSEEANFAALKMKTTKQRKDIFLANVAITYKGVLNTNLKELGSDADLVMWTSGNQGTTVKEFKLEFSEEHTPTEILSEGEQNVCAIADFLTEVSLDPRNCGIILDDPVTSLDHARKTKIATRLVEEAGKRQVVVFTHDIPFMSKLVRFAGEQGIPYACHWMKAINGTPGHLEVNASPRLAHFGKLKEDAKRAVQDVESALPSAQEGALERGLSYLRAACEALIEESLFANVIQRYEDQIRVHNLEEAVFDEQLALRIVTLDDRLSEYVSAHHRSNEMREQPPSLEEFRGFLSDLESIEADLKQARKAARAAREARRKAKAPW